VGLGDFGSWFTSKTESKKYFFSDIKQKMN